MTERPPLEIPTPRSLRYREHAPPPALAPLVECFWTLRGVPPVGASARRVLPDGCSDVLFDLGGSTRVDGEARPRCYAVGTMTRAIRVTHAGAVDLLGVRFHPGAARASIPVPAREVLDGWIDMDVLWGVEAGVLWERLAEAGESRERLGVLEPALTARARAARPRFDALVLRAASLLAGGDAPAGEGRGGGPSVADVAARLGVSRRHLERRFREDVGLSPGELRRVGRLRRATGLIAAAVRAAGTRSRASQMHLRAAPTLGEVAVRAGYHDHAHLCRDFRELAGTTPGAYRREIAAPRHVASVQDTRPSRAHPGPGTRTRPPEPDRP